MGRAMQIISGFVTAPGATLTALTMAAGDSLGIRNARLESTILLLNAWADAQVAGALRIRSPQLHDNVQGLRFGTVISEVKPLMPARFRQPLMPQDTLVVELSGSAVAADIESAVLLAYYDDLPGVEGRFIDAQTAMDRMLRLVTVENTLALGTAGGYSGEEAINAEFDLLKANVDYALLGYLVDGECAAVGWRGADTGNLRVGGPGDDSGRDYTRSWFLDLAWRFDLPLIPVFNAANKAGILLDGVQDENGLDVKVTSILAELSPGPLPTTGSRR